jgi:serine/threonine protein kinase
LLLLVLCFGSIRFIITLEQAFHTQAKLYLLFEFMHGGDLYITAQGRPDQKYTEEEVRMRRRPAHLPLLVIRTRVVRACAAQI